jgi:hypothetical protein
MSEFHNNTFFHDGRSIRITSRIRKRASKLTTPVDLMLARYPADEREQIAELLRILAAKRGDGETGTL